MRILFLADALAPHSRRWVNWFSNAGHVTKLLTFNKTMLSGYVNTPICINEQDNENSLLMRLVRLPHIFLGIRRVIREFQPDIIHAHSAGGYAWMAMFSGFKPFIVTPWGTDVSMNINNSKFERLLTIKALKSATMITSDAEHFKKLFFQLGICESKIFYHSFGTDIKKFIPGKDRINYRKNKRSQEYITIISTRTPNPVHDVDILIKAANLVLKKYKNINFMIVGDGTQKKALMDDVLKFGISNNFIFKGMVEEEDMVFLLQKSDIYVSTSGADAGLAASTAEAMAVGLPVIHAENGDNAKWVSDQKGGYLFPNGDSNILAETIFKLIEEKTLWPIMGKQNRENIIKHYNTDIEMTKIESAYASVVSAHG